MSHSEEYKGLTIRIELDTDPMNPRDWDNLGTMVCWHRNYLLGDEQPTRSPDEYLEGIEDAIILPLYLYDHSGITMNTTGFDCPWDSNQVGFIFVEKSEIRKEYGDLTEETLEKVKKYLVGEVNTYDQYLRGEVYGYVVETEDGEFIDSCWGFFEEDYCLVEAKSAADYEIKQQSNYERML